MKYVGRVTPLYDTVSIWCSNKIFIQRNNQNRNCDGIQQLSILKIQKHHDEKTFSNFQKIFKVFEKSIYNFILFFIKFFILKAKFSTHRKFRKTFSQKFKGSTFVELRLIVPAWKVSLIKIQFCKLIVISTFPLLRSFGVLKKNLISKITSVFVKLQMVHYKLT